MLTRRHLDEAVAKRIVTSEQADALWQLAGPPAGSSPTGAASRAWTPQSGEAQPGEERFKIANGFNEIFVALGVILLGVGMLVSLGVGSVTGNVASAITNLGSTAAWAASYMAILWLLAEVLTARKRMLAPSIVIVVALALLAPVAIMPLIDHLTRGGVTLVRAFSQANATLPPVLLLLPGAAFAVALVHYVRFGFPFSLLVVALTLVALVLVALGSYAPHIFWDGATKKILWGNINRLILAIGIVIFVAALLFDLTDPGRVTNRSDSGFWLHMVAAPMIVHALMSIFAWKSEGGVVPVFITFGVLAAIAIVVDRRAILVAALSYLITAVGIAASQAGFTGAQIGYLVPIAVGTGVVALGVGWQTVRRGLWALLPRLGPLDRLRPAHAA
jgi:hypothetical protein